MKAFHKKRLLKLAEFLENLPTKKFNFGEIVEKFDQKNKCGTICCAVGWCPTVFPRDWTWVKDKYDPTKAWAYLKSEINANIEGLKYLDWSESASKFFGISLYEADDLFYPNRPRPWDNYKELHETATPKQVAKSIRKFLEWKEAGNTEV